MSEFITAKDFTDDYTEIELKSVINESSNETNTNDITVAQLNRQTLKNFQRNNSVFLRLVREVQLEAGYTNQIDDLIESMIQKDPIIAATWLNDLYIKYFTDSKILNTIIFSISNISNEDIRPSLVTMALASLTNNDIEIRENAIRCFENWGDRNSIKCLESTGEEKVEWLNNYKKAVLKDIQSNFK